MKTLTKQNIIDILYGCAVLGTGGGGSLAEGLEMMQQDFDEQKELRLVDLNEIPDDAYVATPYGCGAPTDDDKEEPEEYRNLPHLDYPASMLAFRKLEEYFGKKFFAVSSTELGGLNTAEALHVACQLGLPIIDGDPAGRSVPELQHSTYFVKNVPIYPMGVATMYGDAVVISDVVDDFRAEKLVRAMAVASNDLVGVVDHPTTGKIIRDAVIPGAISYAMKIGEVLRESKTQNKNCAEEIVKQVSGKILFHGVVTDIPWECVGGFNIGEIQLDGKGTDTDNKYRIWFKNENIVAYKNDKIDVSAPDLICMLDNEGNPLTTPNFKIGTEMTIFALPAPEIWKTKEGLECFGPRSFGFDFDYVPFNER